MSSDNSPSDIGARLPHASSQGMSASHAQTGGVQWQPPEPLELQEQVSQYKVLELLGRGGMGAVYKGWQTSLERYVAIKVLPPDVDDGGEHFADRFKQEAKTMAKLSHPCIVPVFDAGETKSGLLYFVMEFIEGTDVAQMVLTQGRLSAKHALSITAYVCDALQYAHTHGVVHRDIKPANIIVNREGEVKVADFGLAKANDNTTRGLTRANMSMGTPDFIAPEALVIGAVADHRADLYAVGVMLYNMLTGEIPRGRFRPASEKAGSDIRFDAIVERCMESECERRYQNATEIRRDLDVILTAPIEKQQMAEQSAPVVKPGVVTGRQAIPPGKPVMKGPVRPPASKPNPAGSKIMAHTGPVAGSQLPSRETNAGPLPKKKSPAVLFAGIAGGVVVLGGGAFFAFHKTDDDAGRVSQSQTSAPTPPPVSKPPEPKKSPPPPPTTASAASAATKDMPWVNSLGMKLVPVPITGGPTGGRRVLFSVWDTRVKDYTPYASARQADGGWKGRNKDGVPVGSGPDHPVVNVNWEDAQGFCVWLTEKEHAEGKLPQEMKYRLPTDHEWSCAVGIGEREDALKLPNDKNGKIGDAFPWGGDYPPKGKVGNYSDETFHAKFPPKKNERDNSTENQWIEGYTDGQVTTAPVGSYPANRFGLYDMGGNVWQWCDDWWDKDHKDRVLRGGAWISLGRGTLLSSNRNHRSPSHREFYNGFRCVLSATPAPAPTVLASVPDPSPSLDEGSKKSLGTGNNSAGSSANSDHPSPTETKEAKPRSETPLVSMPAQPAPSPAPPVPVPAPAVSIPISPEVTQRLTALATGFAAAFQRDFGVKPEDGIEDLRGKYLKLLQDAQRKEQSAGKLKEVLALKAEIATVEAKSVLPTEDTKDLTTAVANLRAAYRGQRAKRTELYGKYGGVLASYVEELTKAGKLEEARAVDREREKVVAAGAAYSGAAVPATGMLGGPPGTVGAGTAPNNNTPVTIPPATSPKGDDRKAALMALGKQGVRLVLETSGKRQEVKSADDLPKGPFELLEFYLYPPNGQMASISEEEMQTLSGLRKLEKLEISHITLSEPQAEVLQTIPKLARLKFDNATIADEGMARLATLEKLTALTLYDCKNISSAGILHLAALKNVKELNLGSLANLDAKALPALVNMHQLEKLDLHGSRAVDGSFVEALAALPELKHLLVNPSELNPPIDFTHFKALKKVELFTSSSDHSFTDAVSQSLATAKSLDELDFHGLELTETHLKAIARYHALTILTVDNVTLPGSRLAALQATKITRVSATGSDPLFDNDTLQSLVPLRSLKRIELAHTCPVTDTGVAEFQRARPDVKLDRK